MKRFGSISEIPVTVRASNSAVISMTLDTWVNFRADTVDSQTGITYDFSGYTATLPVNGWYSVHCDGDVASADANIARFRLVIGSRNVEGSTSTTSPNLTYIAYFTAGTTIKPQIYHATSTKNLSVGAVFQIRLL